MMAYSDLDWLRLTFDTAARHSDDPSTQNGAILVSERGFIAVSANEFPSGLQVTKHRVQRPEKYRWIEHAERGAIYAAARRGVKTDGSVLYCCWFACPECARAIIAAGVREVVGHVRTRQATPGRWLMDVERGERMLTEAGVGMRWLSGRLGVQIRFNEEVLEC